MKETLGRLRIQLLDSCRDLAEGNFIMRFGTRDVVSVRVVGVTSFYISNNSYLNINKELFNHVLLHKFDYCFKTIA